MNYTSVDEAYNIHHTDVTGYVKIPVYSPVCIFCSHNTSQPLMNDGGSLRRCDKCRKNFRATILSEPIQNMRNSTNHLRGTN